MSPTSIKATSRGFEVILMPFDASKSFVDKQILALGDVNSDYGPEAIFLTFEITGEEGKRTSSLYITYPVNDSTIGRLRYTSPHETLAYYRTGEVEDEVASVWILTTSIPTFETKSKTPNSPWKNATPKSEGKKCGAFYMKCPKGRTLSIDFFAKCCLGGVFCGDLDKNIRDFWDPTGFLRRGIIANDFLIKNDINTLLKSFQNPNNKPRYLYGDPSSKEMPKNFLAPSSSADSQRPFFARVSSPTETNSQIIGSKAPSLTGSNAPVKVPKMELDFFDDDPWAGPATCSWSPSGPPPLTSPGQDPLICFDDEFPGLGKLEERSWVGILQDELLSSGKSGETSATKSKPNYWLDILKQEFGGA
ncbi:hypothetical protein TWF730_000127 [Orbilia blumenaviensis]|uniref:Uncharacterized protein n=1 Tax=Orbilia blumenaviensis TaxID=1796055 RepID=A0AAV9VLR1_9PEZI